ncbi:MAG: AAA family ATPase [Chloroflexi bacterium]|nr:AAA family ATPase [Chloroflexota bacterium]
MDRIAVVGTTGSGKTTTARHLARSLGVPAIELDGLYWEPDWMSAPREVFRARVAGAIAGDRWVVDGNYGSAAQDLILPRATTVVWLDYPLPVVLWQLFRRTLRRTLTREELWNGNRERFWTQFLSRESLFLWALYSHPRNQARYTTLHRRPESAHLTVLRFRSPGETQAWLEHIQCARVF